MSSFSASIMNGFASLCKANEAVARRARISKQVEEWLGTTQSSKRSGLAWIRNNTILFWISCGKPRSKERSGLLSFEK
jgi:hypothetical protein